MNGRKTILAVTVALVAAGAARADMVQVFQGDTEHPLPAVICDRDDPHVASAFDTSILCLGADLELPPTGISPDMPVEAIDSGEPPVASLILADKQDSLGLCLYALVSLGMCKSAPWVRRLSVDAITCWYNDGLGLCSRDGQMALSNSAGPTVPCLDRWDNWLARGTARRHVRAVVSLWRKSQMAASVLASCGPPCAFASMSGSGHACETG